MCVVIGVICRRRRVKRGKIRIPTKETGRHGGDAHNDVRLPPRLTSDNYWEIDLDDYSEDTRMPSFGINDSRDASNQNHSRNPTPARLNVNGKPANEQEPIPLTSFGKGEAGGTNTSEENRTGNDDYFILEPQPEDAKDREDLIPVDRQGRHLHLEESGNLSRPMASQQAEDTSRLSNPYYSEIKDIDGSISFPLNTVTNREVKEPGQFSQEAGRPVSSGNYEVVDFDTEAGSEQNSKAKLSQWSPSAKASRSEEASHDQLVMVDNEAYESADKFVRDRTSEAADNDNGGEEDELMMVDNVIYESSGPRQATDQRQPGPDDRRVENHQDRTTDSANGDDDDFMVDNIIYESSGPR
ncbi:uncharacterized protein [Littorina saxatilis]|uniref:Uncharacterized protein n=1 Tax=Littorina saxatilis TaxID=31220 RepID=A0AAN9BN47_9CAEN